MSKVYIASPFFEESQVKWVESKEAEITEAGNTYFSPRKLGIDIPKEVGPERVKAIKEIFEADKANIDDCDSMVANLTKDKSGKVDIGTLWEVGYYLGIGKSMENLSITMDYDRTLSNLINTLISVKVSEDDSIKNQIAYVVSKYFDDEADRVYRSLEFYGKQPTLVNAFIDIPEIPKCRYIFLIDDYPAPIFLMMGYLYAKGISYSTMSLKGYGSNVMIAATSKGHMKLNGFEDELNNINIK